MNSDASLEAGNDASCVRISENLDDTLMLIINLVIFMIYLGVIGLVLKKPGYRNLFFPTRGYIAVYALIFLWRFLDSFFI